MITLAALIFSAILQLTAAIGALWLLQAARGKFAWGMITVAFTFMTARRVIEIFAYFQHGVHDPLNIWASWMGIAISFMLAISVLKIGTMLHTYQKAEHDREETESRFRTLFHNSSDEIYLADLQGNFIEVNQVACEDLGYTIEELRGKNFKDLKTEKYIGTVDGNIRQIVEKGKHTYETEHVAKNGDVISLEVKSRLIDYQGKKAFFSIARDITERKQLERKILGAVINAEERERERISKEIHDGLGPLLSTIKLYVNEIDSEDTSDKERKKLISQTNDLIDEAISSSRTISNTLTPSVIIDFGLVKAIDSFVKKLNLAQKIRFDFQKDEYDARVDQTTELVLYRVVTELITNTIKHAHASKVDIRLAGKENKVLLTYRDDGIGFDPEKVMERSDAGMGLQNIGSRLRSVNGSYQVHSEKEKGTRIEVEVDLKGRDTV